MHYCRVLLTLLIFGCFPKIVLAVDFTPSTFKVGEDCRWKTSELESFRFLNGDIYIEKPDPQNRSAWLKAIRHYRQNVRHGWKNKEQWIDMKFRGVRAWFRMEDDLAKAYQIQPHDRLLWKIEARHVSGHNELCAAFDFLNRESRAWHSWSTVRETIKIPTDGKWHPLEIPIQTPDFDANALFARPILGRDATHDPAPGNIQIRFAELTIQNATQTQKQSLTNHFASQKPDSDLLDRSLYDMPSQTWLNGAFTCHFTFMYDRSFYNPETGQYTMDAFLDDGEKEFGGYDVLLLWHAYPRIGAGRRNQIDFYRDMPGGVEAIKEMVRQCHKRNVRVFINYNPWDSGTNREGKSDEDFLTQFVAETQVDGIFLDTMVGDSPVLRQKLDAVRPGITLSPEGNPSIESLALCNSSWAQWCNDPVPPSLDHRKWIEPRHIRWQIWRWNLCHREEIRCAFFGGSGMIVWENVFGTHNPWNAEDRRLWKRSVAILREFAPLFVRDEWEPFYPACWTSPDEKLKSIAQPGLSIHRWPGKQNEALFTLWAEGERLTKQTGPVCVFNHTQYALFEIPANEKMRYFDLWNGREITPALEGQKRIVRGLIDRISGLGCYLEIPEDQVDDKLIGFIARQNALAKEPPVRNDTRNIAFSIEAPKPIARTAPTSPDSIPVGMCLVPGNKVHINIEHTRRECGCYPDPGTPYDYLESFLWGNNWYCLVKHDYHTEVASFLIDETEVTNTQYKTFLEASGYQPKHKENFLAHWPNGIMPEELADHPVVFVDLDDARAYAQWTGKRLPTEEEWHLAAQGTDGRQWPWGNLSGTESPADDKVNLSGKTMPVKSLPAGRSPYGCYHMSGNVYEWTESERDDGHTRFAIVRGGSFFQAKGSGWYFDGGPRPCNHHAKFLLMWPGLDRCDTIGFRCVKDCE